MLVLLHSYSLWVIFFTGLARTETKKSFFSITTSDDVASFQGCTYFNNTGACILCLLTHDCTSRCVSHGMYCAGLVL